MRLICLMLYAVSIMVLTSRVPLFFSSEAYAKESILTAEQISRYKNQLTAAQISKGALVDRENCLRVYAVDLQSRSDESELILAGDRRLEQDLISEAAKLEQQRKGFETEIQSERMSLVAKQKDYEAVATAVAEQQERLRKCHIATFFISSSLCDLGEAIAKGTGLMKDLRSDMQAVDTRLRYAENGVREVQDRLGESQKSLAQTQMSILNIHASITENEAEISKTKKVHAGVNNTLQDYDVLLDALASTLDEATAVDAESERARRIDKLSSDLAELTAGGPSLIEAADSAVPDDTKRKCSQH